MKRPKIYEPAEFFRVLMTSEEMSEEDLELLIDAMILVTSEEKSIHYTAIKFLLKLPRQK